jgi:hypothetical protein
MKIAYGLASRGNQEEGNKNSSTAEAVEALGGLGIFDPGAARSLVASAAGTTRSATRTSKDKLKGAMQ